VDELCRNLGCCTASFYLWKKRYGDASFAVAKRLLGQNSADDHACPLRRLERENDRLLKIVGQQRLETLGMREVLAKKR
jgi:putative transposase